MPEARVQTSGTLQSNATLGGRYRLLRRVGEARSTEVWEAEDTRLDRLVLVRLLNAAARSDPSAQDALRAVAHQPTLEARPDSPRVLDGGDDTEYGPFVIAELNEQHEPTRRLDVGTVAPPPVRTRVLEPLPPPQRRRGGVLVLVLLMLLIVLIAVLLARVLLAPADQATGQPTPIAATAPPPAPTVAAARPAAPTVSPTRQPTVAPTARPTSAPTAQPTPAPTQPPAAAAPSAASPVDTIRQHYALINAHNYAAGYQLMDQHLQSLNTPADYAGWFANKVAIQPVSVDLVSQNDGQAVVRSVVTSTDRVNGADVTTQVSEQFVLRNENGVWRIDQVTRL